MKSKLIGSIILFVTLTAGIVSADDTVNIYIHNVGGYKVSLLVERTSSGESSLLLNASPEMLAKYLPDGTFPMEANAYLIQTPLHNILVDTGFGMNLAANLRALELSADEVDVVLITHMHGDHIGGLLKNGTPTFPKAKIYLAQQEKEYWTDAGIMSQKPENQQEAFKLAQRTLEAYGKNVYTFTPGELGLTITELLPGIKPVAAFGHTPGHTMYLVSSNGEHLLIWGDLVHAMAIQFDAPGVALVYDVDPKAAAAARKKVFNYVSKAKLPVAGMHLLYPGFGHIVPQGGGYAFEFIQ